jgi:beta-lactamase regulating signal transducer with metallopeptidase domain/protocatechuate 3,4-dioxygenase beta subunit
MIDVFSLSMRCLNLLCESSVKSLAVGLLASLCLGVGRIRNPAFRHAVWATVLCGMLGIPMLGLAMPAIVLPLWPSSPGRTNEAKAVSTAPGTIPIGPAERTEVGDVSVNSGALIHGARVAPGLADSNEPGSGPWTRESFSGFVILGYVTVVLALLARLLLGFAGCRRIARGSRQIDLERVVEGCSPSLQSALFGQRLEVRECQAVRVPLTLGWLRPMILLPEDWAGWSPSKRGAALAHELAHVERRDALFVALGAFNQCLSWFHPMAWLLPGRLASLSERACDDRAITLTGAPLPYAKHLLEFAASMVDRRGRVMPGILSISMANGGDLRGRIEAIVDHPRTDASPLSRRARLMLLASALLIVPALAVLRVGPRALAAAEPRSATTPGDSDPDHVTIRGRVLAPAGRPVAGAKLYLTVMHGFAREAFPAPEHATTGPDGRFEFTVLKAKYGDRKTVVAAMAADHGVGWLEVPSGDKRDDLTLRLVNDVPIFGQVVDLEGKPVRGATFRVLEISAAPGEDLGPWLEAAEGKKREKHPLEKQEFEWDRIDLSKLALNVTTDADGRFRLTGIGRNRLVWAQVDGPVIASQYLNVLTRLGKAIEVTQYKGHQLGVTTYYGAEFRYVAAPTKPVVGVVRDKSTGKPLAGVTVESNKLAGDPVPGRNIIQTTTDALGRYRLIGLPKGTGNKIRLVARDDQPYSSVHADVPDSPGLGPVTVDFELVRGVWIEGKLTDKLTGEPAQGHVDYFALDNNPNVRDYSGFEGTIPPTWGVGAKEDGSFRVVGLPGPGLIVVFYTGHHLLAPERDDEFGTKEPFLFTSPRQLGLLINYTALARIDPPKGVDSVKRDLTLDPGWTFTGTLHGPDGKALVGAQSFGLHARGWSHEAMKTAEFTVEAFNSRRPRDVIFRHPERALVGVARPPKENGGSVEVQMAPGATITARLVDRDGQPQVGVKLDVWFHHKGSSLSGDWSEYSPGRIWTDREGRFRVEALVPDYEFLVQGDKGKLRLGGAPRSGQIKDLGDVKINEQEE